MVTTLIPRHSNPLAQPEQGGSNREQILLQGISWETFELLIRELESQPSKRLTYDHGLLEIWMPLALHERYKKFLARLVEILTEELEIEICSLGSCTWRRSDLSKGVEADECYYIQNEALIQDRLEIDLGIDPPPDLAIEIDSTSLSIPRLPIYAALGVLEVWRFDGECLQILILKEGEYGESLNSIAIPLITPEILQDFLGQAQSIGETSWAKLVRGWVRSQM